MQELKVQSFFQNLLLGSRTSWVHIPLDVEILQANKQFKKRENCLQAHEKESEFYQHVLFNTKGGQEALHYLTGSWLMIDVKRILDLVSAVNRTQLTQLYKICGFSTETRNGCDRSIR